MELDKIKEREIMPGFHGKIINGDNITWAFWRIDEGSELPEHKHIHEQIMHVIDGKIKFTFDGKTLVHGPGSIVVIPSNMPHSGVALTQCKIMDVFTPVREDLLL